MDRLRILLIDNSEGTHKLLQDQLHKIHSARFDVDLVNSKLEDPAAPAKAMTCDAVLFGEHVSGPTVARLTKHLRSSGVNAPVVVLTRQSEAHVNASLRKAGVDDMLNVADIDSPVFGWTFLSTLKHVGIRRKAQEFDSLQLRLQQVNDALTHITHELSTPIGTIRSVIDRAEHGSLSSKNKAAVLHALAENVNKVDEQLKELMHIRQRLGETTKVVNKALNARSKSA